MVDHREIISKLSSGQLLLTILLSSAISFGSTITIMNYAPSLVPLPLPKPDIQLASVSLSSNLRCEAYMDWTTIDELTKTITIKQDSVLIIIFSSKVNTLYTSNAVDQAFLIMSAYVDGSLANPSEVVISYIDEDSLKGTVAVFHYPLITTGTHTVTFSVMNRGANPGKIETPIVEILAIPVVNAK